MLKGNDAVEVKKVKKLGGSIQLNSSHPKHKLYVDDTKIEEKCKTCEKWTVKDVFYAVCVVKKNSLQRLIFVYGNCYAAKNKTYSRVVATIEDALQKVPRSTMGNELGTVKKIDPLEISNLRIRGMWTMQNPFKFFSNIYSGDKSKKFTLACVMRAEKFNSFNNRDRAEITNSSLVHVSDVEIKNPDNPAKLHKAKLITFEMRA